MTLGVLSLLVAVLSLIVGTIALVGVYYNKAQMDLTKKQVHLLSEQSDDKKLWAARHAEARRLVMQTHRFLTATGTIQGYTLVFPDSGLRSLIQTYLVEMDWSRNTMAPRILDTDQFLLPTVQDVIERTLETVDRFKREHPDESVKLSL